MQLNFNFQKVYFNFLIINMLFTKLIVNSAPILNSDASTNTITNNKDLDADKTADTNTPSLQILDNDLNSDENSYLNENYLESSSGNDNANANLGSEETPEFKNNANNFLFLSRSDSGLRSFKDSDENLIITAIKSSTTTTKSSTLKSTDGEADYDNNYDEASYDQSLYDKLLSSDANIPIVNLNSKSSTQHESYNNFNTQNDLDEEEAEFNEDIKSNNNNFNLSFLI